MLRTKEDVLGGVNHFSTRLEANTVAFLVLACDPHPCVDTFEIQV